MAWRLRLAPEKTNIDFFRDTLQLRGTIHAFAFINRGESANGICETISIGSRKGTFAKDRAHLSASGMSEKTHIVRNSKRAATGMSNTKKH